MIIAGKVYPAEVEDALAEHLRTRLAGYKVPRTLVLVPTLPRTPTGKIELRRAKDLAQEHQRLLDARAIDHA